MVSLHLASFGAAWALGLSLEAYLVLVSVLLTLELGIYLALVTAAARRQHLESAST